MAHPWFTKNLPPELVSLNDQLLATRAAEHADCQRSLSELDRCESTSLQVPIAWQQPAARFSQSNVCTQYTGIMHHVSAYSSCMLPPICAGKEFGRRTIPQLDRGCRSRPFNPTGPFRVERHLSFTTLWHLEPALMLGERCAQAAGAGGHHRRPVRLAIPQPILRRQSPRQSVEQRQARAAVIPVAGRPWGGRTAACCRCRRSFYSSSLRPRATP